MTVLHHWYFGNTLIVMHYLSGSNTPNSVYYSKFAFFAELICAHYFVISLCFLYLDRFAGCHSTNVIVISDLYFTQTIQTYFHLHSSCPMINWQTSPCFGNHVRSLNCKVYKSPPLHLETWQYYPLWMVSFGFIFSCILWW